MSPASHFLQGFRLVKSLRCILWHILYLSLYLIQSLQDAGYPYSLKILATPLWYVFSYFVRLFSRHSYVFYTLRLRSAILCSGCSKIHFLCLLLCLTFISFMLFNLEINTSFFSLGFWRWCMIFEMTTSFDFDVEWNFNEIIFKLLYKYVVFLDFKLSPCSLCSMFSIG